jgi:hypothetical protein
VTKLEVLQKGYSLCHTYVAIHLETHVCDWISGVDIPNYVLSDDVQAWCLPLENDQECNPIDANIFNLDY